jgi:hypothetical protein
MKKKIICIICNKEFFISPSRNRKYCSRNCYKTARSKFYSGWKHTEETKQKISKKHKGKTLTEDHKKNLSEANKGQSISIETRHKKRDSMKPYAEKRRLSLLENKIHLGKPHTEKSKKKMSVSHKKNYTEEMRKNARLTRIKIIEENNGVIFPSYNKKACEWFKDFDNKNNTNGMYATNGGEFYIKELGYWVDYINFDLKLIMEWDEENPHYINGELSIKDKLRQKEIQNFLPDFKFDRIREKSILLGK